jgi:hypothetical protein
VEPILSSGEFVVRFWQEITIIASVVWALDLRSKVRNQKRLRVKLMYEYERCRNDFPKDKLFMWPTRSYDPRTDSYGLHPLKTEDEHLQDVLRH